MEGLSASPLGLAAFVGFVVSYIALLGLYPRLSDQHPQLARAGIALLAVPVAVIIIDLVSIALGFGAPFGETTATAAFLLFAGGIALFGGISFKTQTPSRAIGLFLVVFAVGVFVPMAEGLIYGFPTSDPVTFVTTLLMAVALTAIGYLLRVQVGPTDRTKSATDTLT